MADKTNTATTLPIESIAAKSAGSTTKGALQSLKVRVIGQGEIPVKKALGEKSEKPGKSQSIPQDPFHTLSLSGDVIEPPFDMLSLAMLPENSSEMEQCIEAMEINIEGFGHRYISRVNADSDTGEIPKPLKKKVNKERVDLINFFQYCTIESFVQFRRKLRKDLEVTGNAYIEVVRDNNGKIQSFTHLPSYQMRLGRVDDKQVKSKRKILKLNEDGSVVVDELTEWRRFRKFVQSKSIHLRNLSTIGGYAVRWFKEFGDVREYNNKTGKRANKKTSIEDRANEVIHLKLYSSRTPYGLPRYVGNMLSIFGDRAAEEINYITFRNNNIPSMVVLVSNGQLTGGSIERIEDFVESQIQGSDNYSKFLILEAEGEEEGEESGSHVKVEVKPLVKEQHKDALFQNYSENNHDKVRRAWRLPPIFVGRTDEYTRATAEASRVLADEQIFSPERAEFDELLNRIIFPEMGVVYHRYKSNSPNTTDNQQLVKILAGAEKTGGMTPRIARMLLEDILSGELPEFPKDFPADVPFSLTMAEAVKNKADPAEPGQQTTALKRLWESEDDLDDPMVYDAECEKCGNTQLVSGSVGDPLVDHLLHINKRMEKRYQEQVEAARSAEDDAPLVSMV